MKKLLIILIAALSVTAASAQNRNDNYNRQDRYHDQRDNRVYNDQRQQKDYGYNNGGNVDYSRQAAYDRMNRDYDKRIEVYRNDRSINARERDRRIYEAEQERQQQSKSFGKGVVTGAIVGVLLGVLIGGH